MGGELFEKRLSFIARLLIRDGSPPQFLRQHQPNRRASGVELFEKRLEAVERLPPRDGSPPQYLRFPLPTVTVVSESVRTFNVRQR